MADETTAKEGLADSPPPASGDVVTAKPKPLKPSLADVLAKQASGEILTPQDRGVLGASKRKSKVKVMPTEPTKNILLEVPPASPPPAAPAPVVADNPFIQAETAAAVPAAAVSYSDYTPDDYKRAAEAICDAMDNGTQIGVGYYAEQAGADRETAARYESAVALKARNRQLMVDNSEPVIRALCRWFKCSPEKLPEILRSSSFAAGLIAHTLSVFAAVKSIGQSVAEKKQNEPAKA